MGAGQLGQGVLQNKLMIDINSLSKKQLISTRVGQGLHHPADTLDVFYHPDFIYHGRWVGMGCHVQTLIFPTGLPWQKHFLQKTNKWKKYSNPTPSRPQHAEDGVESLWP